MAKNIKNKIIKKIQGFSLIELIVAIAIFSILASGVVYVFVNSYKNFFGVGDKQVMVQFAQEGMEAVRSIRDNSWQSIVNAADGSDRGLVKNNGLWEFSGTENTLNGLTRVVVVSDVLRNSSGSIVAIDGVEDPDTKRVTVTVSATGISDYVLTTYFTNWSAKMWEQTDWSGTTANEFWASMITASSSYSNISTSTVGQVSLSAVGGSTMSWSNWVDLVPDESVKNQIWEDFYNMYLGPDGKSLYVIGTTNFGLIKYDISKAQSGIIKSEWKIAVPWHIQSMALHPSNNYAYVAKRVPADGVKVVCVANIANLSINTTSDCYDVTYPGGTWYIHTMIVNAAGDKLFAFDHYGYAYVFSISGGGSTLSFLNRQLISSAASTANPIYQVYLDESGAEPYIYLVGGDNSGEFRKMGILSSGWLNSTSTYAFVDSSSSYDFNDIEYLETVAGKKRFILGTENSSKELIIYEDQGTSLTEIGSYNLSPNQTNAEVTSDGQNMAFIHYYSPGGVYAVDITNRASPTTGSMSNTTFDRRSNYTTYDQMLYSTTSHGFFVSDHTSTHRVNLHFIGKDFTRATGATYSYKRAITLGLGSTVSSGPHTNFPVVISETQEYLKTVANGGKVQNINGYDIIFTSDASGATVLDHEIEAYNPTTGELVAWVRVPSLDADTTIYMFYGNSAITSTQEHVDGVWSNGYQLVNHMVDSGTGAVSDSVSGSNSFFKYGVSSAPTQSGGKIGRGQYFDGTNDYLTLENTEDKEQGYNDFTVEFWMKPSSAGVRTYSSPVFFGNGDSNTQDGWMFRHYTASTKKLYFSVGDGSSSIGKYYVQNAAITDNVWTHVAMVADRDVGLQAYINGAAALSCTIAGACAVDSTAKYIGETYTVAVGRDWSTSDYFFTGEVDELRISTGTPRTAGWLATGYNNMTSTSTFYSIASETTAAYYNSPGSIVSSIIDLGSSDKTIDSLNIFQNVPSGCNLSVALEGANNTAFSGYTSATFADSSTPHFTSSTPATLNNLRYLRYRLTLTACNSNSQTPTLYSLRLNYR